MIDVLMWSVVVVMVVGILLGVVWWIRHLNLLRALQRLFAPKGNLLTADIVAEATLHLMSDGQRKAIVSKFEDNPTQDRRQQMVQHLIFTGIEVARVGAIGINWQALAQMYPPPTPTAAPAPPAPVAPA